jgi:hypothetical protein
MLKKKKSSIPLEKVRKLPLVFASFNVETSSDLLAFGTGMRFVEKDLRKAHHVE